MPGWLVSLFLWGGLVLAAINGVALVWALLSGAPPSTDPGAAEGADMPYLVYVVLLAVGAVLAAIGAAYRRRAAAGRPRARP